MCSSRTVPAPTRTSGVVLTSSEITCSAPGTVIVISTIGIPPRHTASAANRASWGEEARITRTIPIRSICARTSCFSMEAVLSSAGNSCSRPLHHLKHFLERGHGCVAGSGHGQGAMSGSALDCPLWVLSGQKAVNQTRSEGVAAANAIQNLQILPIPRLKKITLAIADRTPIISRCRRRFAKRRRHDLEGKILHDFPNHLFEALRVQGGETLVGPRNVVA